MRKAVKLLCIIVICVMGLFVLPVEGKDIKKIEVTNRVISLVPSNTELLFALGFGNEVVGVSDFCSYPEDAVSLPKVGGISLRLEKILSLRPTIVIDLNGMHSQYKNMFAKLGITYVDFKINKLKDVAAVAVEMAKLLGDKSAGIKFANWWNTKLKLAELILKDKKRLTAYIEIWDNPMQTAGNKSYINELLYKGGFSNIIKLDTQYPVVNSEQILKANPQVIFICYPAKNINFIKKRSGWQQISAVKNNRIFILDQDLFVRPGPRNITGIESLKRYFKKITDCK